MREFSHYLSRMYTLVSGTEEGAEFENLHSATWHPLVDIYEREDAIVIVVELPGVDKERIGVCVERGTLKITGVRHKRIPEGTRHVHQMEIPYGHFARYVKLPRCADIGHIEAEYDHGYLTVEVPREERHD